MKSVYIDVLITVNVFIDFILILCAKKALCINTSFKKMLLASLPPFRRFWGECKVLLHFSLPCLSF